MVRITSLLLAFLLLTVTAFPAAGQETPTPALSSAVLISAPTGGQALQGAVPISGTSAVPGFLRSEIAFRYTGDRTDTWFLIAESEAPIEDGLLTLWDTTTLTDGVYDLRLRAWLADGSVQESLVLGVRVRNYTPVETNTPAPASPTPGELAPGPATAVPLPTFTPSPSPIPPSATPFGPNPAQLTTADLAEGLRQGALAAAGLFALGGLYGAVRYLRKRE